MSEENLFNDLAKTDDATVAQSVEEAAKEAHQEGVNSESDVIDYSKLSDSSSKYNRVELDGQTVTISKAEIKKPHLNAKWINSRDGKSEYKGYQFIVYFDTENKDREYISGMNGFKKEDGGIKLPSVDIKKNKTQSAKLFNVYKCYVMKKENLTEEDFHIKYGLQQFMAFLNSKPKARMITEGVEWDDKITRKNFVAEFI